MNILIYCPDRLSREAIARHLVDIGNHQLFIAETEQLVVSLVLHNEFHLVLMFYPSQVRSLIDLMEFLREKRRKTRVRLLPDSHGVLMAGWREVITAAVAPPKKRSRRVVKVNPRFKWKAKD